jgi:hypothetical protein
MLNVDEYKLCHSSLWDFLFPPDDTSLLGSIFFSALLSHALSVHVLFMFYTYIKGKSTGKVVPALNLAPRHEDVLGEWRYSSTHS